MITLQQRDRFDHNVWSPDIVSALEVVATRPDGAHPGYTYRVMAGVAIADTWTIPIGPLYLAGIWSYDVQWNGVSMAGWPKQVRRCLSCCRIALVSTVSIRCAGYLVRMTL